MFLSPDFRTIRLADVSGIAQSPIKVDLSDYESKMRLEMAEVVHWMNEKKDKLSRFVMTGDILQQVDEALSDYPRRDLILQAVREKNGEVLHGEIPKLWSWLTGEGGGWDRYTEIRSAVTALMDYSESMQDLEERYSTGVAEEQLGQIMGQTRKNMERVESLVREAIGRIPDWQGHPVVIEAQPPSSDLHRDRYRFEPADDAMVSLAVGRYPPSFSLFMREDGSIMIDDVLEGGDTDFFTDIGSQTDYFNLINEIRNPNSTQKTKILTLYTARSSSDREMLERAKTLPVNVFLTDKFDHALGLASDLAGMEGMRDVWQVKIDSRYLTKTLEGPVSYYQVTVPDAPVKSMSLVHAE